MNEIEPPVPLPEASTSATKKTRKRRGILGVPVDKPMLFSFTSKELWPDEHSEEDEMDSDEDYKPVKKPRASPPAKKSKINVQSTEEAGSSSSNTELIDSDALNDSQEAIPSDESLSSASSPKVPHKKNFDTNGKAKGKKARAPKANGKAKPKAKPKIKKQSKSSGQTTKRSSSNASRSPKKASSLNGNGSHSKSKSPSSFNDFNLLIRQVKIDFDQILPPEILTKIFSTVLINEQKHAQTLIKLSQVCENWRSLIIASPILWQRLDLDGIPDDRFPITSFQQLNDDNALFSCVKELNLSGWNGAVAEKIIQTVADSTNFDLELLSVKNCRNISSKFLDTVIGRCPNLKSLDISAITYFFGHNIAFFDSIQSWSRHGRGQQMSLNKPLPLPPTKKTSSHQNCQNPFTSAILRPLMETCGKSLKSLYMSENMMPSFPTCISVIMELCPNLEVLDVSNVASLGARSTSISVDKLQRSCPLLRVLRAANVNFTPTVCSAAAAPVPGFPHLEELSIPFHESFMVPLSMLDGNTDWTIELLTKGAENLTLLDIRGSRYISPRGLLKIPTWSMKHLSISNCPKLEDDTMEMVFTKWNKTLVDVDLSWNKSERCMKACVQALCDLDQEETQLKSIQLRGSAISYESLRDLLRRCPLLTSIDLQSCRSLPRGIKRAFSGDEFVQLRTDALEGKYD